ncbi:homeobox protein 2-like [Schistocerca piceifrons]|uniref:homeobox protein 2-like n=1 Tax=Schistocerca piceifrons TaxID=274613 RepID=UPI001F5F96B0|nr:homeobox protein 2-like [Schistocerca piceifrons]
MGDSPGSNVNYQMEYESQKLEFDNYENTQRDNSNRYWKNSNPRRDRKRVWNLDEPHEYRAEEDRRDMHQPNNTDHRRQRNDFYNHRNSQCSNRDRGPREQRRYGNDNYFRRNGGDRDNRNWRGHANYNSERGAHAEYRASSPRDNYGHNNYENQNSYDEGTNQNWKDHRNSNLERGENVEIRPPNPISFNGRKTDYIVEHSDTIVPTTEEKIIDTENTLEYITVKKVKTITAITNDRQPQLLDLQAIKIIIQFHPSVPIYYNH